MRLNGGDLEPAALARLAARLLPLGQARGAAVLLTDRLAEAVDLDFDGLHLSQGSGTARARQRLGDRNLGVACALSRHQAMEAGEAGADYVAFAGEVGELEAAIGWWAETMTLPCVAEAIADPAEAARLVKAGADFICPDPAALTRHGIGAFAATMGATAS